MSGLNMVVETQEPQPPSSAVPAVVVPSSAIGRFEITTLKDIKIQNFSSQSNNDPASEIVHHLEEKLFFCTNEAQWSEPLFELVVHPKGHSANTKDFVSAMIRKFWFRPYFVSNMTTDFLRCTVSVLDINGSQRFPQSFAKKGFLAPGWGLDVFNADDIGLDKFVSRTTLIDEADELLPEDVLTVRYEMFFEFCVCDTKVVLDPFKKGVRIAKTPLYDNLMYFRSVLSMMENALDEMNYVLQLQGTLKELFCGGKFTRGEMITPISDGWEEKFAALYHLSLMRERQTKISACYGGWMNVGNVEVSLSDKHLETSKVSAEIERRCCRTVQLAEVKLLLFQLMDDNLVKENEINNMSETIVDMFVIHKSILDMLVDNEQVKNKEASHQDKETKDTLLLIRFTILFLSRLIRTVRLLSENVVIATTLLNNCSFFIPKAALTLQQGEGTSKETQTTKGNVETIDQEKVETECEKAVKNDEIEIWDKEAQNRETFLDNPRLMVDGEGACNDEAAGDGNIETKAREGKQMESVIEKNVIEARIEKERDLKSQNGEMQNQEVGNEEERNDSVANLAHDDENVGNQKEAAVRNKKEINVIKLVENEIGFHTEVKARHEESEFSKESDERQAKDLWQLISETRDSNGHLSQANSLMVEGCLLKASSFVFERMMETHMQEQSKRHVKLDVGFETLKLFVNYLKTGELADSDGYDWKLLYKVAHQYDIQRLLQMCSERIAQNITIDNSSLLEDFAERYQDDQLREKLKKFLEELDNLWEASKMPSTSVSISSITSSESADAKKESHTQEYAFYQ